MIYCEQGVQASRLGSTVPVQYVSILMELCSVRRRTRRTDAHHRRAAMTTFVCL